MDRDVEKEQRLAEDGVTGPGDGAGGSEEVRAIGELAARQLAPVVRRERREVAIAHALGVDAREAQLREGVGERAREARAIGDGGEAARRALRVGGVDDPRAHGLEGEPRDGDLARQREGPLGEPPRELRERQPVPPERAAGVATAPARHLRRGLHRPPDDQQLRGLPPLRQPRRSVREPALRIGRRHQTLGGGAHDRAAYASASAAVSRRRRRRPSRPCGSRFPPCTRRRRRRSLARTGPGCRGTGGRGPCRGCPR